MRLFDVRNDDLRCLDGNAYCVFAYEPPELLERNPYHDQRAIYHGIRVFETKR